jgi:nitroimidazol reductase NimA-like FMN-containing flavoprotein (pyridoxamine 5'-phosphate oxidase superfamily)
MTAEELDAYLGRQRTLRLATVGDDGVPHVVPLWFVWHEQAIWLNSLRKSRRHRHLVSGNPVGLVVDDGDTYGELRGVRMTGRPVAVADDDPIRIAAYRRFGRKYFDRDDLPSQRSYETVRIVPDEIASWDFAKIPAGRDAKVGLDRP